MPLFFCLAELGIGKKYMKGVVPMDRRSHVSVFTDGSCNGNPGPGGYAAILKCGRFHREIVGRVPYSTNNRMELTAVIEGLSNVRPNSNVTVFSDSKYVVDAVNQGRLAQWQSNGWKRIRAGTPVLNKEGWQLLCDTIQDRQLNVRFQKVTAHKGHYYNERADYLARQAAKSA